MRDEPVYRGILGIDIEGFGRPEWTDPVRSRLRGRLYRLVGQALARAHIDPSLTTSSDTGDRRAPAAQRLRLRVVVHAGEVLADAHGHSGEALNHAGRLLDAEATRAVLASSPAATLVLVISDDVYQQVVRHAYRGMDPAAWQPVRIHAKETTARAWVHLPGLAAQPRLPAVLATLRVGPVSVPIPRELSCPPTDFTGRGGELARLRELLAVSAKSGAAGRAVVISAIDGMGGIGKSALALQVAHQLADAGAFPDGQLYVNLQGATPGLAPLEPLDALGQLLRSLGLDPATIPTKVEEAAARFRSLAAERRLLVVLDNAASARQVHPLLPASPSCAVLVTSRQVLATLQGIRALHLDILPEAQALELLGRIAGPPRVAAEPQAAAEVAKRCGYLPLALRIAGARLAARPTWPVQVLAERLTDATGRLEELAVGELAVRASFDVSLHALQESHDAADQAVAAAFGMLSLPDGPDLSLAAAARLLDQPEPATQRLLERCATTPSPSG